YGAEAVAGISGHPPPPPTTPALWQSNVSLLGPAGHLPMFFTITVPLIGFGRMGTRSGWPSHLPTGGPPEGLPFGLGVGVGVGFGCPGCLHFSLYLIEKKLLPSLDSATTFPSSR